MFCPSTNYDYISKNEVYIMTNKNIFLGTTLQHLKNCFNVHSILKFSCTVPASLVTLLTSPMSW